MLFSVTYFLLSLATLSEASREEQSAIKRAEQLSRALHSIFEDGTKHGEIAKAYANLADAEVFSPEAELKALKEEMEVYLKERTKLAWNMKLSLEQRPLKADDENGTRPEDLNNPSSHAFVRYVNVKRLSDGTALYRDGYFGGAFEINGSQQVDLRPNPNFYGVPTNSDFSAIHVPTPIYSRDPELLERIRWSDIDQQYRRNREQLKDLSFQKFCSESGFMRFFPTAPWLWEERHSELDLFDCRNTDWYVETSTVPRNLIILLDTSGSMLGQRFEIARQTIESVLGTLSDSDFFNIIQFSKTTHLLEQCGGRELVQATLRNKKVLLSRLTNISSEGKADYENALHKAFVSLMQLPEEGIRWRTKEEAARDARSEGAGMELDQDMHYITLEDNVLVAPERFIQAIRKFTGNQQRMGCQDVIMLITDGAPGFYKEIFELYNKDKRVRFFSFIVGEEAKDFDQVKWMACSNRGFMAHIVSMADVQEKVQQYMRVLSKTVARQKAAFSEGTPVWSGATRERMADQFAVSVSFPVVLPEGQFMGVSSVSLPLTELAQMAHPTRVGGRSHFMVLDANGYVLLHPQLRALEATGELKAGFNSVEFADAEVQKPNSARVLSIDCQGGKVEPRHLDTLFALDELRHVYPQKNHYQAVCLQGSPYALVLAMPQADVQRLRRARAMELTEVQLNWMKGREWRLHPGWRYCFLNDSDWTLGPEGAFREYARQMRASGKMPEFCKPRKKLVERVLLDLEATSGFGQLWDREWERNRKNGVHLAFFVAQSGLARFKNQSLADRLLYEHPDRGNDSSLAVYKHFLLDLNPNAAEAHFFQRTVRQPKGRILFDLNRKSRLWQVKERKTAYGHAENESLLALAFKSVHVDGALAGVAGIEFLYDTLVSQMRHIGCLPDGDRTRCYLLDEHGFVLFTGNKNTRYEEFAHANIVLPELVVSAAQNWSHSGRKRKGASRGIWAQRLQHQQSQVAAHLELGRFFGQLNRVAEWTMELLVRRGFYKRVYFTDAQAVCDPPTAEPTPPAATAAAGRVRQAFWSIASSCLHLLLQFGSLLSTLLIPIELVSGIQLNTFASLLKITDGRFPCRTHSAYYLAQHEAKADGPDGALLESDSYERPCRQNAAQCAVKVFASWVPNTNLLLVMVRQDARSHCFHHDLANHCPLSQPPAVPFGFSSSPPPPPLDSSEQASPEEEPQSIQCTVSRPQERTQPVQCLRDDFLEDDADEETCSGTVVGRVAWSGVFGSLLFAWLIVAMMLTFRP